MKKVLFKFFFCFALVSSGFWLSGCSGSKLVWSTSNGIVTYNRHTGQFELMWDTSMSRDGSNPDTVWICPEDTTKWVKLK